MEIEVHNKNKKYCCINCGSTVKSLYKEYSATVLKLTNCEICKNVADKYVEYDLVIVIIDLILLRIMAYRHILLNTEFKNFWKLSIALILLETYSNWVLTNEFTIERPPKDINTTAYLYDDLSYFDDFQFYELSLKTTLAFSAFTVVAYFLTLFFSYLRNTEFTPFIVVWKAVTLSTTGTFLLLPSLIWETHIQEFHILFVSLYTTLSQLLAHKAICNSEKTWSLLVIFSSHLVKMYIMNTTFKELLNMSNLSIDLNNKYLM